jgi:hypothetical protein
VGDYRPTPAHACEVWKQTIDLDEDRTRGERYELSFRFTVYRGLIREWSIQLVIRDLATMAAHKVQRTDTDHAVIHRHIFAEGLSEIDRQEIVDLNRGMEEVVTSEYDREYRRYEQGWREMIERWRR